MMRTTFDPDADAFYARFAPDGTAIVETREAAPGVMLDLDENGHLVGVEVLSITSRGQGSYGGRTMQDAAE